MHDPNCFKKYTQTAKLILFNESNHWLICQFDPEWLGGMATGLADKDIGIHEFISWLIIICYSIHLWTANSYLLLLLGVLALLAICKIVPICYSYESHFMKFMSEWKTKFPSGKIIILTWIATFLLLLVLGLSWTVFKLVYPLELQLVLSCTCSVLSNSKSVIIICSTALWNPNTFQLLFSSYPISM